MKGCLDTAMDASYHRLGEMDVRFDDDDLDRLETDSKFTAGCPAGVVKAFRRVMQYVRAASDERDLRAWPGLRFEKLEGKRLGQYSMRLNDQFRLIIELAGQSPKKVVVVCEIDDYH